MFAAMDDPGSRFLHCVGTTTDGEFVRVQVSSVPSDAGVSSNLLRRLRTQPTEHDLHRLLEAAVPIEYVESDVGTRSLRSEFFEHNPFIAGKFAPLPDRPVKSLVACDPGKAGHAEAPTYRLANIEGAIWKVRFNVPDRSVRVHTLVGPEKILGISPSEGLDGLE